VALSDTFLKLKGIDGESKRVGHEGEIEIESWSVGAHNASSIGSGTGGGVSRGQITGLTITTRLKKESPKLLEYCASGKHVDEATLIATRAAGTNEGQPYLKYTLKEAFISQVDFNGAGSDELPMVSMTLDANVVKLEYIPQGDKGESLSPVVMTWDQAKGSKG